MTIATETGEAIDLDGICIIGTVKETKFAEMNGEPIQELINVTLTTSRYDYRLSCRAVEHGAVADTTIPAFQKLLNGVGKTFLVKVAYERERTDGIYSKYVNFWAIDAAQL